MNQSEAESCMKGFLQSNGKRNKNHPPKTTVASNTVGEPQAV